MKISKEEFFYLLAIFFFGLTVMILVMQSLMGIQQNVVQKPKIRWTVESIDTMKNSRDLARQDLNNAQYAIEVNKQVAEIAATGANYVAIDTPYDAEFLPVLKLWVRSARAHGLHVWFRGNFSGWEGWFNYPQINEQQHIEMTKQFILNNKDLFQNGDIFTSCPECENGIKLSLGDSQAVASYRQFLITEYTVDKESFAAINKQVASNYFSMNADAARAIMDPQTTQALDGLVVIDHYVMTPERLADDVSSIAKNSGGKIVLGEFGAPIPDINGNMTDNQQKQWLQQSLQMLSGVDTLVGLNYWVNEGGSTALWNSDGSPKPAVSVITSYYQDSF